MKKKLLVTLLLAVLFSLGAVSVFASDYIFSVNMSVDNGLPEPFISVSFTPGFSFPASEPHSLGQTYSMSYFSYTTKSAQLFNKGTSIQPVTVNIASPDNVYTDYHYYVGSNAGPVVPYLRLDYGFTAGSQYVISLTYDYHVYFSSLGFTADLSSDGSQYPADPKWYMTSASTLSYYSGFMSSPSSSTQLVRLPFYTASTDDEGISSDPNSLRLSRFSDYYDFLIIQHFDSLRTNSITTKFLVSFKTDCTWVAFNFFPSNIALSYSSLGLFGLKASVSEITTYSELEDYLDSGFGAGNQGQTDQANQIDAADEKLDEFTKTTFSNIDDYKKSLVFDVNSWVEAASALGYIQRVFMLIWDNSPTQIITLSLMLGLAMLLLGRGAKAAVSSRNKRSGGGDSS